MKKILGIAMVLGLMCSVTLITGCSKGKEPQAKGEPAIREVAAIPKGKDITEEPTKKEASGKEEVIAHGKDITEEPTKKESSGKEEVIDLGKGIKLEMVLIPAGEFMMGSPANEKGRSTTETQHQVTLTKPFYIGRYEVTQEQWEAVMGNNPSTDNRYSIGIKGANLPVTNVSWYDCQEFLKKLNEKTSGGYRLPIEAEWEYSCRAGTTTAYSFGDTWSRSNSNSNLTIGKVGKYLPNKFGLYDMHGNVCEWCEDWKADYPAGEATDPKGPATGETRVSRGGSYSLNPLLYARSSSRGGDYIKPTSTANDNGFRLAKTVDFKTAIAPPAPKPDPTVVMPAIGNFLVAPFSEAKAKEEQKKVAKSLQKEVEEKEDLGNGIQLEMVLIPAGKFMMGSKKNPVDPFSNIEVKQPPENETPQHEVTLTKPYYMGKYEVTQEQWFEIMGENPSREKGRKLPVTDVSWKDYQKFIKKLNAKTNGGYRLPYEGEWEYACRAGTATAYSFEDKSATSIAPPVGAIAYSFEDKITPKDANYADSKIHKPVAVGSYKPNAFGLYDMHGNVEEWCEDWDGAYPAGAVTDPKGPAEGDRRVLRGGSFNSHESAARSSSRSDYSWDGRYTDGFRLAKTK